MRRFPHEGRLALIDVYQRKSAFHLDRRMVISPDIKETINENIYRPHQGRNRDLIPNSANRLKICQNATKGSILGIGSR